MIEKPAPLSRAGGPNRETVLDGLARRYAAPLKRYFERRLRNKDDASDLVQDVLLRLARLRDLTSLEQPEHYVFKTASSALRDKARRDQTRLRGRHVEFDASLHDASDFSPDRVLAGRRAIAELQSALRELPQRTRDIFVLRAFEDQKTSEVANALGLSARSVELHYAKALAFLAAALQDHR